MLVELSDKAFFEQPISSKSDLATSLAEDIAFSIPRAVTNITEIAALSQHNISRISIEQFCGVIYQLEDMYRRMCFDFLYLSYLRWLFEYEYVLERGRSCDSRFHKWASLFAASWLSHLGASIV